MDIERLKELAEKATPGPRFKTFWPPDGHGVMLPPKGMYSSMAEPLTEADVDLAVACDKETVLGLIAEVERLNKALDQAIAVIYRYDDCFGVDAGDPTVIWGMKWEDGVEVTWNDFDSEELALVLKERGE